MRLAYFYLMTPTARGLLAGPAAARVSRWSVRRPLRRPDYLEASDLRTAEELVAHDPFVRNSLIAERWVKTWITEEPLSQNR